jgi:hypothetical protein
LSGLVNGDNPDKLLQARQVDAGDEMALRLNGPQHFASGVLVEFNRPVGLFGLIALQQHLESLFGCKVDLGTPRSLRPGMKERVLQEAVHVA